MSLLFLNIASVLHDQLFWSYGDSKMGSGVLDTLYIATPLCLELGTIAVFLAKQVKWDDQKKILETFGQRMELIKLSIRQFLE